MPALDQHLRSHENNFNLIRLIAAAMVIFGHSYALCTTEGLSDPLAHLTGFGYSGSFAVDIFFMISGIFVTQSWQRDPRFLSFAVKRFARIWPGLVFCLGITVALLAFLASSDPAAFFATGAPQGYALHNALLHLQWDIPGIFETNRYKGAINGSLWTLVIETKLYVMIALLGIAGLLGTRRRIGIVAALLLAAYTVKREAFGLLATEGSGVTPVYFFFLGMLVYSLAEEGRVRARQLLTLAVLLLLARHYGQPDLFEITFYVLMACATLYVALIRLPRFMQGRWNGVNDYSYGLYLYGFPIQQLLVMHGYGETPLRLFAAALPLAFVAAIISWHLVEKPALRTIHHLTRAQNPGLNWRRWLPPIPRRDFFGTAALGFGIPLLIFVIALAGAKDQIIHAALATATSDIQIVEFGPNPVTHGEAFNKQADGSSSLWAKLSQPAKPTAILVLNGIALPTAVNGTLVSATVPDALTNQAGAASLWLQQPDDSGKMTRSAERQIEIK